MGNVLLFQNIGGYSIHFHLDKTKGEFYYTVSHNVA